MTSEKRQTLVAAATLFATLCLYAGFFFLGATRNSVTVDEYVHVPVGVAYWRSGDFRLDYAGNPPLMRLLYSAPTLAQKPKLAFKTFVADNKFYSVGHDFMVENFHRYQSLYLPARLVGLAVGSLMILLLFFVARAAWGNAAGLLAAGLAALNPNWLAYTSIVSLDAPLALFTVAFWAAAFQMLKTGGPGWSALCGAALGLTLSAKFTALINLPLFLIACAAWFLWVKTKEDCPKCRLQGIALTLALAWLILNAGYKFHGTFEPLAAMPFKSGMFKSIASHMPAWAPGLLPREYLLGIDHHKSALGKVFLYYLNGQTSTEGWPWYFLVARLLKEPLPIIGLEMFGVILLLMRRRLGFREACWLIAGAGTFLFFSFFSKVDLGIRYLLPILPFSWLFAAYGLSQLAGFAKTRMALPIVFVWLLFSLSGLDGNYLGYFNLAAGGQAGGRRHLLESNLDWGQNLIRLKEYLDANGVAEARIAQYGLVDPGAYGIKHDWLPCDPTPGVMVISQNIFQGLDPFQHKESRCYDWLRDKTPDAVIGGALLVFNIEPEQPK